MGAMQKKRQKGMGHGNPPNGGAISIIIQSIDE